MMQTDLQDGRAQRAVVKIFGLALVAVLLAACAQLPPPATRSGVLVEPPVLVPLDGILAQADAVGSEEILLTSITARADRLRRRADQLRQP